MRRENTLGLFLGDKGFRGQVLRDYS